MYIVHTYIHALVSPQAVPGPGQYDVKSQFERRPSSVEDEMELGEVVTHKAPFGSRIQVIFLTTSACIPL